MTTLLILNCAMIGALTHSARMVRAHQRALRRLLVEVCS